MPPAGPLNPVTRMENAMLLIIARRIPAVITGGCAAGLAVCGALINYEGAKTMAPGEIVMVLCGATDYAEQARRVAYTPA